MGKRVQLGEVDTYYEEDGGGDPEIPMEHTLAMRDGLKAQLAVVPGTEHGMPSDKPDLFNRLVADFVAEAAER